MLKWTIFLILDIFWIVTLSFYYFYPNTYLKFWDEVFSLFQIFLNIFIFLLFYPNILSSHTSHMWDILLISCFLATYNFKRNLNAISTDIIFFPELCSFIFSSLMPFHSFSVPVTTPNLRGLIALLGVKWLQNKTNGFG